MLCQTRVLFGTPCTISILNTKELQDHWAITHSPLQMYEELSMTPLALINTALFRIFITYKNQYS